MDSIEHIHPFFMHLTYFNTVMIHSWLFKNYIDLRFVLLELNSHIYQHILLGTGYFTVNKTSWLYSVNHLCVASHLSKNKKCNVAWGWKEMSSLYILKLGKLRWQYNSIAFYALHPGSFQDLFYINMLCLILEERQMVPLN